MSLRSRTIATALTLALLACLPAVCPCAPETHAAERGHACCAPKTALRAADDTCCGGSTELPDTITGSSASEALAAPALAAAPLLVSSHRSSRVVLAAPLSPSPPPLVLRV